MVVTEWITKVDTWINDAIDPIANAISDVIFFSIPINADLNLPILVIWLVLGSFFFTLYFKFINIRGLGHTLDVIRGKYMEGGAKGLITPFQALTTAVSGTVGLGNIAGVGVAIAVGGPGAAVWMSIAGFLGMSSKFIESALGVIFRKDTDFHGLVGGPMFYLSEGLAKVKGQNWWGLGKGLAVAYCIMCICGVLGGGNMLQANQSYQQLVNVTGGDVSFLADKAWLFGLVLAFLVGVVIIGGIEKIAKVTEKLVPFMGTIYIGSGLILVLAHLPHLPEALMVMWRDAFTASGVTGGVLGSMITGIRRSIFSSEVGVGFTAMAHATVKTNKPLTEGFVSMLEPFIDTIVVCNTTALVIVLTKSYLLDDVSGVTLTSKAFETVFPWFPYVLALAVMLFAFSTLIAYSYYGVRAWCYLFGENDFMETLFKVIFLGCIVVGATMQLRSVIDFSDAMFFAMTFVNFIGLYLMAPFIKKQLEQFEADTKASKAEGL